MGMRWGVTPLQVLWVAARLDSEQMPCFPYPPALHLSLGSPEVSKVGGSAQAAELRVAEIPERKPKLGDKCGRAPGNADGRSVLLPWL